MGGDAAPALTPLFVSCPFVSVAMLTCIFHRLGDGHLLS
jgi:hypothetical protein